MARWIRLRTAGVLAITLVLAPSVALKPTGAAGLDVASTPLPAPFEVRPVAENAQAFALSHCDRKPPAPVRSLDVTSIYDQEDDERARIDAQAKKVYEAAMRPVRDFNLDIAKMANAYHAEGDVDAGRCVLNWMKSWAEADALSRLGTRQSVLSTTRIIAGLSLSYLQVRDVAKHTGTNTAPIERWLASLAERATQAYGDPEARNSNRQNHRYWGGLAAASAGIAAGRKDLLDWGLRSHSIGACQIAEDGSLPLELDRGKRARDYHNHALAPLVLLSEIGERTGRRSYDVCGGAMHRLVAFVVASSLDPSAIQALTGEEQVAFPVKDGFLRGDRFAWVPAYRARFPERSADIEKLTLPDRLISSNLGGDNAALYSSPD